MITKINVQYDPVLKKILEYVRTRNLYTSSGGLLEMLRRGMETDILEFDKKRAPAYGKEDQPPAEPSERGSKWRRGKKRHEKAERPRVEEPPEEQPKEEEKPDPDAWKKEPWAEELWERMAGWSQRIGRGDECRETDIYLNRKLETDMASPESCREFLEWIKQWERRIEEEKRKQEEEEKRRKEEEKRKQEEEKRKQEDDEDF